MKVFIGYDAREDLAYRVCEYSLRRHASLPLEVLPLGQPAGLYHRTWHRDAAGHRVDDRDGRPFSTDFAFSRFLVPALVGYDGWALYCDCDFLFRADVAELIALRDARYAVQCVKHDHRPAESSKMDGQAQTRYPRKNWSSLVLWNAGHPAHRGLTVEDVSTRPGAWLHGFRWLQDGEIGELPESWNWLAGWSRNVGTIHAVHFTGGGPWFPEAAVPFADEWVGERDRMQAEEARRIAAAARSGAPDGSASV